MRRKRWLSVLDMSNDLSTAGQFFMQENRWGEGEDRPPSVEGSDDDRGGGKKGSEMWMGVGLVNVFITIQLRAGS